MAPTIKKGDYVIYRAYKKSDINLPTGSIVIAEHPLIKKHLIIKRLYLQEEKGVKLIGDNHEESNDSRHFGFINYNNLIGIAERIIPNSSYEKTI